MTLRALLILCVAVDATFVTLPLILIPGLGIELGVAQSRWSLIVSAGAATTMLGNLVWGKLILRHGLRGPILVSGLCRVAGLFGLTQAAGFGQLAAWTIVMCMGGGTGVSARVAITSLLPESLKAKAHANLGAAMGVGFIAAPALAGAIGALDGGLKWAIPMAMGLLMVGVSAATAARLPSTLRAPGAEHRQFGFVDVLRVAPLRTMIALTFLFSFLNNVAAVAYAAATARGLGWGLAEIAFSSAVSGVIVIGLQFTIIPRLVSRYSVRPLLILSWGLVIAGNLLLMAIPATQAVATATAALVVLTAGTSLSSAAVAVELGRVAGPARAALAFSANSFVVGLARISGPAAVGLGTQVLTGDIVPAALAAVACALGFAIAAGARKVDRGEALSANAAQAAHE